jgi:RNA polymerase sigma-B factor
MGLNPDTGPSAPAAWSIDRSGRGTLTGEGRESVAARRRGLLRAFRQNGELAARDRLVADCLPLVSLLARRYANQGEQLDDLIQVGSFGLLKAIDRFDFDHGAEFTTYAASLIEGGIKHHLRDNVRPIRIPRPLQELYVQLYGHRDHLTAILGRAPTNPELAKAAGVPEHEVIEALQARHAVQPGSLSAAVLDDNGSEAPLVEFVGDDDPGYQAAENRLLVATTFQQLGARDRRILHMRYHGDLTQSRIAAELGITQMHVSRLIRKALAALGEAVEAA